MARTRKGPTKAPVITTTATRWRDLKKAVAEAAALGAEFRIVGEDVEISGDIPEALRLRLPDDLLRDYLGAERDDNDALDFLDHLGVEVVLVETQTELEAAIASLTGAEIIAIDIETSARGVRPEPIRINKDGAVSAKQPALDRKKFQPGLSPHCADIAAMSLYGGGARSFVVRGAALQALVNSRWLREQHLVIHNAGFDLKFLRQHSRPPEGVRSRHPIECSMQATGLLFGTWSRGLDDACEALFGAVPPKTLQMSCWSAPRLSAGQVAYSAIDAILCWRAWDRLQPQLEATGRLTAYRLQRNAIGPVADMELRGLLLDRDEHARQVEAWSRELSEARRDYLGMTGKPAPTTPDAVRAWLAEVAGERLANWPRTPQGALSIEGKHLKRLTLSDIPTVKPVLAMLAKAKLLSNFGAKLTEFINPTTGRIHCHYNLAGTKAGRFSASKPNLQQLPGRKASGFKACIIAAPGNVLVGGDWSQVEMRGAAWISGDIALTRVYEEERDIHSETAALVAGVLLAAVTDEQRDAAKAVNFGSIYGVGARTLAENAFDAYGIDMTLLEAQDALDRFFQNYSTLQDWMRSHAALCQARGYIEIGVGRVVEAAWEPGGHLSYPQCCNIPIQGAAADAMLRALAMVLPRLGGIRGGLVATIHDEILLEVHEDDAGAARQILEETMIEAFEKTFPGAPTGDLLKVKIGRTWKETK